VTILGYFAFLIFQVKSFKFSCYYCVTRNSRDSLVISEFLLKFRREFDRIVKFQQKVKKFKLNRL